MTILYIQNILAVPDIHAFFPPSVKIYQCTKEKGIFLKIPQK